MLKAHRLRDQPLTDKQTDKQTDRQTDRKTNRQTDKVAAITLLRMRADDITIIQLKPTSHNQINEAINISSRMGDPDEIPSLISFTDSTNRLNNIDKGQRKSIRTKH